MKKSNIRILSFVLIVSILFVSFSAISVGAYTEEPSYMYKDKIFELLELKYPDLYNNEASDDFENPSDSYCYSEEFMYYSEEKSSTETTPDYIMVDVYLCLVQTILVDSYIGDFAVVTGPYSPYIHGYMFYIPAENKLLTLEEAIATELNGIEEGMKTIPYSIAKVGDCDGDFELTIKDATCIQKCVAGLKYPKVSLGDYNRLVYDFDKDEDVTIKDATAIQKYIAGLEY